MNAATTTASDGLEMVDGYLRALRQAKHAGGRVARELAERRAATHWFAMSAGECRAARARAKAEGLHG